MQTQHILFISAGVIVLLAIFSYFFQKRAGLEVSKDSISNPVHPQIKSDNSLSSPFSFGFKFGAGIFPWLVFSGLTIFWIIDEYFDYKIQKFTEEMVNMFNGL